MNRTLFTLLLITFCCQAFAWDPTRVALHLVGDSTMSDKPNLAYPERGWGQLLPEYLNEQLEIVNHAANGRSTRRFINEGRWALVLSELKEGDYVLIQFGHNDQKFDDPARYASAKTDYPAFLRQYIKQVQEHKAIPMIASSICRRHYDEQGMLKRTLIDYASAAKHVAESEGVAFFALNDQTCHFLASIGEQESRQYFVQVPPDLYTRYPAGKTDNTHLNVVGASKVAQFFIRELLARQHPLAQYVYRDSL